MKSPFSRVDSLLILKKDRSLTGILNFIFLKDPDSIKVFSNAFEKTFIESGSFKKIKFKIPVKDLSFFNINNESTLENGDFMISVGPNSKELTSIPFNVN